MYEIADYERHFDIAQSRKAAKHTWFACPNPNKESGRKFTRMMHHELSLAHYGSWILLVGLASTMPQRGKFIDGSEYTIEDILLMLPSSDKEGLKASIAYFVEIGWIIDTIATPVPAQSHCDTTAVPTTVHNSTVQNNTLQNKTEQENVFLKFEYVSSPEKHETKGEVAKAWAMIPRHRQKGIGEFRTVWVQEITRTDVDPEFVRTQLKAYYESAEGRGKYARKPATLITQEFWEEGLEVWGNNTESDKFPESTFDHDTIVKEYCNVGSKNVEIVQSMRMAGLDNGRIAYKIWSKKI